ncbi:unnamed protein product [Symbiodinium natans]|uniref:Uncharacterized protein n=1 Tax=Symbiodinium natans TaxID=878477 RepID=A0A812TPC4_9DINO|nr:unnamed protein product [Symbiodinium natans]
MISGAEPGIHASSHADGVIRQLTRTERFPSVLALGESQIGGPCRFAVVTAAVCAVAVVRSVLGTLDPFLGS